MQSLYYYTGSLTTGSNLYHVPDNSNLNLYSEYEVTNLIVCSSLYQIIAFVSSSGSNLTTIFFPIEDTNLYYLTSSQSVPYSPIVVENYITPQPELFIPEIPTSSSFFWSFSPNTDTVSSNNRLIITGSQISVSQSQSFGDGYFTVGPTSSVNVIVSGSGPFYTASVTIYNNTTFTTASYTSSHNSPALLQFSSSLYANSYTITTFARTTPSLGLIYNSTGSFPVSPTSSVSAWNSALQLAASSVQYSGSAAYLLGGNINTVQSLNLTSENLTGVDLRGMSSLVTFTMTTGSLTSYPIMEGLNNLRYVFINSSSLTNANQPTGLSRLYSLNICNNNVSGSLQSIMTNVTQSLRILSCSYNNITGSIDALNYLYYLDCSHNSMSGSVQNLSGSRGLYYVDCSHNALTGSMPSFNGLISLGKFKCNDNQLTGSIPFLGSSSLLYHLDVSNNQLSDYVSGSVPGALKYINAFQNNLSGSAIERLVKETYEAGASNGYLNLSGSGNSVASLTAFQTASLLEADRGWEVYLNGTPVTYSFDADFLVFTYQFESASGGVDLDTRTRIVSPIGTKYHGYDCYDSTPAFNFALTVPPNVGLTTTASTVPYIYWSGDNTGVGVESVYVDMSSSFGSNDTIQVECRAFWYVSKSLGSMSLDIEAYQGGYMSQSGFQFQNVGGTQTANITIPNVVTTLNGTGSEFGELIGNAYYNKGTNILTFI